MYIIKTGTVFIAVLAFIILQAITFLKLYIGFKEMFKSILKLIKSLFQRLCKPPNWCKIKTLVWRFYYVKKKDEPRGKSKKGKAP